MKYKFVILISVVIFCITSFLNCAWAAGSATLSWTASSEEDLAGYRIYYGIFPRQGNCPPGGYSKSTDAGKVTTYTFNNLNDGQTYYFSLTAYDIHNNESCFSKEISKTIPKVKLSWFSWITRSFQEIFSPLKLIFQTIF